MLRSLLGCHERRRQQSGVWAQTAYKPVSVFGFPGERRRSVGIGWAHLLFRPDQMNAGLAARRLGVQEQDESAQLLLDGTYKPAYEQQSPTLPLFMPER